METQQMETQLIQEIVGVQKQQKNTKRSVRKSNPNSNRKIYPSSLKTFKRNRDYQSQQEAVLIGLLNIMYDVVLQRPYKLKCESDAFLPILKIKTSMDDIDVHEFIKKRCTELLSAELKQGVPKDKARRRMKNNEYPEVLHYISDILELKGYAFVSRITTGRKGIKKETILQITSDDGTLTLTQNMIADLGKRINTYLVESCMVTADKFVLEKNNSFIASLLNL
ncbi:TATA-binding protein-associated phosphoprotein [Entamoeba marina]